MADQQSTVWGRVGSTFWAALVKETTSRKTRHDWANCFIFCSGIIAAKVEDISWWLLPVMGALIVAAVWVRPDDKEARNAK